MRLRLVLPACALAATLFGALASQVGVDAVPAAAPRPPALPCKPEAPVAVQFDQPAGGAERQARFSLRPLLELSDLRWHWELGPGVALVEGPAAGTAAPQRDALTSGEAILRAPDDGTHHVAKLIITGERAPGSEAEVESVTVERTMTWGLRAPAAQLVLSLDPESGAAVPVAVVPTTHVPARAAPRNR